jgi:hypothetical protein
MRKDLPDKYDPASVADFYNQPISVPSDIEHGPLPDSIRMRINPPYVQHINFAARQFISLTDDLLPLGWSHFKVEKPARIRQTPISTMR